MRKITWRLMIALLTFGVGVSVAMWFVSRSYQQRERVEVPVASPNIILSNELATNRDGGDDFEMIGESLATTTLSRFTTKSYKAPDGTRGFFESRYFYFKSRLMAENELQRLVKEGDVIKRETITNDKSKLMDKTVTVKLKIKDTGEIRFASYHLTEDEAVVLTTHAASSLEMLEKLKQIAP